MTCTSHSSFVPCFALGNRPKSVKTAACDYGNNDFLYGGDGVDYIIAGALDDTIDSGNGTDVVFGDHGSIYLSEMFPYKLLSAQTTNSTCEPGNDTITLGEGDDVGFGGGTDGDTIYGDSGRDLIIGDFAIIEFYPTVPANTDPLIPYPKTIDTLDCDDGGRDFLYGGDGNDYIIAGALGDVVDSGADMDLVFGDHG